MNRSDRRWGTTVALVLLAVAVLFFRLGLPFELDGITQDVFHSQRSLWDILLHRGGDPYHPELPYLLLQACLFFGRAEWLARLPSAVSAAAAVGLFHRFALETFDPLVAVTASLLFLLNPAFVAHTRDVIVHAAFTALAVATLWSYSRSARDVRTRDLALLGILAALTLQASHFGILVAAVAAFSWVFDRRPPARRLLSPWFLLPFGASALVSLAIWRQTIPQGAAIRRLAAQHPELVWGNFGLAAYARGVADLFWPASGAAIAACLAGLGAWRWRREGRSRLLWAAWLVLPVVAGAAMTPWLRVRPYYFVFVLPAACALIASGIEPVAALLVSFWDEKRGAGRPNPRAGAALAAVLVAAAAFRLAAARDLLYQASPRADFPAIVARIREADRGRTVVFDPHFLHTLFIYYSARDPMSAIRSCAFFGAEAFVECRYDGWRVLGMTNTGNFSDGWEERSLVEMERLARQESFWVIEDPDFVNVRARDFLARRCRREGDFAKHALHLCAQR